MPVLIQQRFGSDLALPAAVDDSGSCLAREEVL